MFKKGIFVLLVLCTLVLGQEKNEEFENSIGIGARAILFEFNGLAFMAANDYAGGIGGKYFIAPNMAVRGMLRFNTSSSTDPVYTPEGLESKDEEFSETTFGIGAGIEYHFAPSGHVSPYFGGGIAYMMYSSTLEEAAGPYPSGSDVTRDVIEVSGVNELIFSAIGGAEVFIIKEVSLSAEYILSFIMQNDGETKYSEKIASGNPPLMDPFTVENESSTEFTTASRGVLTLSIYF